MKVPAKHGSVQSGKNSVPIVPSSSCMDRRRQLDVVLCGRHPVFFFSQIRRVWCRVTVPSVVLVDSAHRPARRSQSLGRSPFCRGGNDSTGAATDNVEVARHTANVGRGAIVQMGSPHRC